MFGSGRAALSLRESYRQDLRAVRSITAFATSAFTTSSMTTSASTRKISHGKPVYNFSYVDQIYDGLLANGVRPFVELSFMPRQLAAARYPPHVLVPPGSVPAEGLRTLG